MLACVTRTALPPAIRNVLEARFARIQGPVSAEEFLAGRLGLPLSNPPADSKVPTELDTD